MKLHFWRRLSLTLITAAIAVSAHATDTTTETEKAILVRIAAELEYLQGLAAKAQAMADPSARVRFSYPTLLRDLEEIQASIERHAAQPRRTPRQIPSLEKRYSK